MSLEVDLRHVWHPFNLGTGRQLGTHWGESPKGIQAHEMLGESEPWGRHSLKPAKVRVALWLW